MIATKWPLHPKPKPYQTLGSWIRDLSHEYGVSYNRFCKKVLNLTKEEMDHLSNTLPEKAVLTLSNGTGIAVEDLRQRTLANIINRLLQELPPSVYEKPFCLLSGSRSNRP